MKFFKNLNQLCPYRGSILLKLFLSKRKNLPSYHSNGEDIYKRDWPISRLSKALPFTNSCELQTTMGYALVYMDISNGTLLCSGNNYHQRQ